MRALVLTAASLGLVMAQFPGQYPPGQGPGQYPPGQGPGRYPGQGQPPIPGQTPPGGRGRGTQPESRRTTSRDKNTAVVTTTAGILRRAVSNQMVIEADDHRIIWYRLGDKMTVEKEGKPAELASFGLGDYLSVDSTADDDGNFTATEVRWEKAATPADRAAAQREWDLPRLAGGWRPVSSESKSAESKSAESKPRIEREPGDDRPVLRRKNADPPPNSSKDAPKDEASTAQAPQAAPAAAPPEDIDTRPTTTIRPPDPAREEDDAGPPALRRGAPPRRASEPAPERRAPARAAASSGESSAAGGPNIGVRAAEPEPATAPDAIVPQEDPVIQKARAAAETYADSLPNFFAQQMTTRYRKEGRESWRALDIVTADVAYENGRESYKNIKVGNKAVNKTMDEIGGTRSTGEFATLMESLLGEGSGATFRRAGQDTIQNRAALKYTYEVPRERGTWRVEAPSQLYYPALRGSVWIDKETSRVLRIEQQGRGLPVLFPFDTVETTTDYDFIRLGTTGPFLLPVEAEVLSCQRGTSLCSRNRMEFRNYRKFGAESNVTFDDKQ